ncbi:MAG: hypothetical protein ABL886_12145, partial [Rhodoglobus sp.]
SRATVDPEGRGDSDPAGSRATGLRTALTEERGRDLRGFGPTPVGDSQSAAPIDAVEDHQAAKSVTPHERTLFRTPHGHSVEVIQNERAVVPTGKVEAYSRGKTPFTPEMAQEFKDLKQRRQMERKEFDRDPANAARIKELEKLKHNYERSLEMARTLDESGIPETPENNNALLSHLLEQGGQVSAGSRVDFPSEFVGSNGKIKTLSTWVILPDGRAYLSTIKLIPRKP